MCVQYVYCLPEVQAQLSYMCLDCGHFVFLPAYPCCSHLFFLSPPPSFSPTHHWKLSSPLREFYVQTGQRVNCTRPKNISHIYLALTRSVQYVRKMSVTLTLLLVKKRESIDWCGCKIITCLPLTSLFWLME